jgi:hypothetical protein
MISLICEKYNIENYTINNDGSIDVAGNVNLWDKGLVELPLTFNKVTGWFDCSNNRLTTLKGSPKWIGGFFTCGNNQLTSLKFSPDYVGGDFYCKYNKLIDNYCDTEIGGRFYTSLEQDGLIIDGYNKSTNYNDWRKMYKRKKILNDIFNM